MQIQKEERKTDQEEERGGNQHTKTKTTKTQSEQK